MSEQALAALAGKLREASENARRAPNPELWKEFGAPTLAWVEEVCGDAAAALSAAEERIKDQNELLDQSRGRDRRHRAQIEALKDRLLLAEKLAEAVEAADGHYCSVHCDKWSSDSDDWQPCVGEKLRSAAAAFRASEQEEKK